MTDTPTDREAVEALANWCDRQSQEMTGWTSIGDDAANRAIKAEADVQQDVGHTLRALLTERDALEAEVERLREALEEARPLVEKWCHYQGNTQCLFDQYLGPIDAALAQEGE